MEITQDGKIKKKKEKTIKVKEKVKNTSGDLRVWWIPEVPMPSFHVYIETVQEAALVLNVLSRYDEFQLNHDVVADNCTAGGLSIYEDEQWVDWHYEDGFVSFEEDELDEYIKWIEGKK